jgi:hypothetical protein
MKTKIIIIALACTTAFFTSCSGGNNPSNPKDTVNNRYGAAKDTSKIDTSKVTGADNSATGGTKNSKDTTKKDSAKK